MAGPWDDYQSAPQPTDQGPWEDYQQEQAPVEQAPVEQAAPQAQAAPQSNDDRGPWSDYGQQEPTEKLESSAAGTFVRDLAKEQAPVFGGLAGAGVGAGAGALIAGPPGAFVGALAGGFGGGYLANGVQDYIFDKLGLKKGHGWFSDEQAQADEEQHPWAKRAADLVGTAEAFTGGPASGMARLASGGINAGLEAGQQAYAGKFEPTDIALRAAEGALLPNMRKGLPGRVFDVGASAGERAAASIGVAGRTSPVSTRGASETPPPPPEDSNVGNVNTPPERSEREYPKENATPDNVSPVTQGQQAPDIMAAISEVQGGGKQSPVRDMVNRMSDEDVVDASKQQREAMAPRGNGLGGDQVEGVPESAVPPQQQGGGKPVDPQLAKAVIEHAEQAADQAQQSVGAHRAMSPEDLASLKNEAVDTNVRAWAQKHGYDPDQFMETATGKKPVTAAVNPEPVAEPGTGVQNNPQTPDLSQMQEIGNAPGQKPAQITGPTRPKVIDIAIAAAKERGQDGLAGVIDKLPPEQQAVMATKYLRDIGSRNGQTGATPKVARVPAKPITASNGVTVRTQGDADRINRALSAADQAAAKFAPTTETDPRDPAAVQALKERLSNMLGAARAANQGQLPHQTYKPTNARGAGAVEPPASWQLMQAADRFLKGNRFGPKTVADFMAKEQLLRSGNPEDARTATLPDRTEAGIGKSRRAGDEAIAAAEANRRIDTFEPVPAEDVTGKPQPIENAADLQNFESGREAEQSGKPLDFAKLSDEDVTGKPVEIKSKEDLDRFSTTDMAKLSDEDLDRMIDLSRAKQTPSFKEINAEKAQTVGEKMAAQRAARLAAGKQAEKAGEGYTDGEGPRMRPKDVIEFMKDEGGSAKIPPLSEVPLDAYKTIFGSGEQKQALNFLRRIFAPETVSNLSRTAANMIRQGNGVTRQALLRYSGEMEKFNRIVDQAPIADQREIQYAIDRGDKSMIDPKYHGIYDAVDGMLKDIKAELKTLPQMAQVEFLKNYFPHMFKTAHSGETKVHAENWYMKQGNTSSLNKRLLPDLKDAVENNGYKLAYDNPIETSMRYAASMHAYIRSMRVIEDAMKLDHVKEFPDASLGGASGNSVSAIPDGWAEIKGRALRPGQKLYAPQDFADVYNNSLSQGYKVHPVSGKLFDALQKSFNWVTSVELGASAFHAFTMAKESIITGMDIAIQRAASGDIAGAAKGAVAAYGKPVTTYMTGKNTQRVYMGDLKGVPQDVIDRVNAMRDAGASIMGRGNDPTYQYSSRGTYFNPSSAISRAFSAFKEGASSPEWGLLTQDFKSGLTREYNQTAQNIKEAPGARKGIAVAKEVASSLGRVMQTISEPLFEKYIPAVKAGAYMDMLGEWQRQNPGKSYNDLVDAARKIGDSIDNRFGEMAQDNLFAHAVVKQSGQLMFRSWSWNLGTGREIGGGALGALSNPARLRMSHPDYDPRIGYILAMPAVVGMTSALYQYLKTREMPGDTLDFMVPKTGGKSERYGAPERAILPGYEKDLFGWADDPRREFTNKLATLPHAAYQALWSNEDYAGHPIRNPQDPASKQLKQFFDFVSKNFGPISLRQRGTGERGSNISAVERATSIRPAPAHLMNEPYIQGARAKHDYRAWGQKVRSDAKNEGLRER